MKLNITTFNCENLFGRYRMLDTPPEKRATGYERQLQVFDVIVLEPGRSGRIKPKAIAKSQRESTAGAILAAKPDILAVQEVENLSTLRMFNDIYCKNYFDRIVCIDGNDARGIDVGLMIKKGLKVTVLDIRTHADETKKGGYVNATSRLNTKVTSEVIFARDCLEVDILINGKVITFLVNHFKAQDNKTSSTQKRMIQSKKTKELTSDAIKANKFPIVLGDLNIDVRQKNYDKSLDPIYKFSGISDPFSSVDSEDLWTHYYSSKNTVSRLDYILVDKRLTTMNPTFFRRGLSPACKQYAGPRLKSMSGNDLEASDHCPTTITIDF